MSRLEQKRSCFCLNITVTIVPEEVLSLAEHEVVRGLFAADSSKRELHAGRLLTTTVKHAILTSSRERLGWTVYSCDCCLMAVFAADATSRIVLDGACKHESDFANVMTSPSFSKTFGVCIQNKGSRHSTDVSGCPEELLAMATETINNEKIIVDQRIKAYAYQQREQFEAFRQRTLVELEALSAAVVKERAPPVLLGMGTSPKPLPHSVASPFNLTPPRSSPTPPARAHSLLDRGPGSGGSVSLPSRDSVSLDSPRGELQDTPTVGEPNDSIFEFEEDGGTEKAGYYLPQEALGDWSPPDDEEEDEPEERTLPKHPTRNEGFKLATSLPISIPQSLKSGAAGSFNKRGSVSAKIVVGSVTTKTVVGSVSGLTKRGSACGPAAESQSQAEEPPVNVILPPHSFADPPTRSRKGSEKDAEEQFEHAVRFQSLGLKTRTYL